MSTPEIKETIEEGARMLCGHYRREVQYHLAICWATGRTPAVAAKAHTADMRKLCAPLHESGLDLVSTLPRPFRGVRPEAWEAFKMNQHPTVLLINRLLGSGWVRGGERWFKQGTRRVLIHLRVQAREDRRNADRAAVLIIPNKQPRGHTSYWLRCDKYGFMRPCIQAEAEALTAPEEFSLSVHEAPGDRPQQAPDEVLAVRKGGLFVQVDLRMEGYRYRAMFQNQLIVSLVKDVYVCWEEVYPLTQVWAYERASGLYQAHQRQEALP